MHQEYTGRSAQQMCQSKAASSTICLAGPTTVPNDDVKEEQNDVLSFSSWDSSDWDELLRETVGAKKDSTARSNHGKENKALTPPVIDLPTEQLSGKPDPDPAVGLCNAFDTFARRTLADEVQSGHSLSDINAEQTQSNQKDASSTSSPSPDHTKSNLRRWLDTRAIIVDHL